MEQGLERLLWAGKDTGPGGEFRLRDRRESQRSLWVRSKGENQETKPYEVGPVGMAQRIVSGAARGRWLYVSLGLRAGVGVLCPQGRSKGGLQHVGRLRSKGALPSVK